MLRFGWEKREEIPVNLLMSDFKYSMYKSTAKLEKEQFITVSFVGFFPPNPQEKGKFK